MRYRGHVKDGRIVPDPSISLPEGAEVRIEIVPGEISKEISQDQFRKWRGRGRLPHGLSVDDYLKQARDGDGN